MKRKLLRFYARVVILGLGFAQFSLAAYACPLDTAAAASAAAAHADCADENAAPVAGVLCEAHCQSSAAVPSNATPAVALLPNATLMAPVRDAGLRVSRVAGHRIDLVAMATAPPVAIRFCRLLL
ncbi:MAG: hypothetical protein IT521_10815 [Burkholderiales bacterium]|nr:hypothetical protein [Burkholderiales bacterium]